LSTLVCARAALLVWARCTTMSPVDGEVDDSPLPQNASIRESGRQRMFDGPPGADATTKLFVCTGRTMTALTPFGAAEALGTMVSPCSAAAHVKRTATVDSKQWLCRGATAPPDVLQALPSSQPLGNSAMRGQGERAHCPAGQSLLQYASIEPNRALLQLPARSHSCRVCLKTRSRLLVLSITSLCIQCKKEGTVV
jgi:hypothetical protein